MDLSPVALEDKTFTSVNLCYVNFFIHHNKNISLIRKKITSVCQSRENIFHKEKVTFNAYDSKQLEMNNMCVGNIYF